MSWLMAVFLGFVQGVAEFLPISSSGHLSLLQNMFHMSNVEQDHMFFDVLLHMGTLVAVCIVYRKDIAAMIREFFLGIHHLVQRPSRRQAPPPARRLVLLILIATVPLVFALPLKGMVESLYVNTLFIGCALLVTGLLLFCADRLTRGSKTERSAMVADAVIVGCAQAVALVPGLSRSGTTITAGMFCGFHRKFAVRFSFLLSLPAVLGANLISLVDALKKGFDMSLLPVYGLGVLVATVSGYFAIRFLKRLAQRGKFGGFAWYCWAVGALAIIVTLVRK